jgi:hypothetical protein
MLDEDFGDCADAALGAQCTRRCEPGARNCGEGIVDPRKAFGGMHAVAARYGLEGGLEKDAKVDPARDAAQVAKRRSLRSIVSFGAPLLNGIFPSAKPP